MATTAFQPPTTNSKYYLNPSAGPSPPEAYFYGTSQNASTAPMAETAPPSGVPHAYWRYNVRQLRPPRQVLYIPAQFRRTDFSTQPTQIPLRPSAPDTPPASKDNSYESGKSNSNTSMGNVALPPGSSGQEQSLEQLGQRVSLSASEGLKATLEKVTGPPTTAHWKPDASAHSCAICHSTFTWFFRRHHCRKCGNILCANHSKNAVPLDQNARYHPNGEMSKCCDACFEEWKVVNTIRHSRASSVAESRGSPHETTVPPPIEIPEQRRVHFEEEVGNMAQSDGRMEWSTF